MQTSSRPIKSPNFQNAINIKIKQMVLSRLFAIKPTVVKNFRPRLKTENPVIIPRKKDGIKKDHGMLSLLVMRLGRFFHHLVFKTPAAREVFSTLMGGWQRVFQTLEKSAVKVPNIGSRKVEAASSRWPEAGCLFHFSKHWKKEKAGSRTPP